jgi:hypothetical protein
MSASDDGDGVSGDGASAAGPISGHLVPVGRYSWIPQDSGIRQSDRVPRVLRFFCVLRPILSSSRGGALTQGGVQRRKEMVWFL